jgi:membrane-associated HD superfamily phosphohydrolase
MTDINQDFSDQELQSIIDNASEKSVSANSIYGRAIVWLAIVIVFYTVVTGAELFRFKQTQNRLHLALSVSAILVVIAYALIWANVVNAFFLVPVATWIMLMVPAYLLSIWLRSMTGRLQNPYSQHFFKFVQVWLVLFSIAKLMECIFYILLITASWYKILDYYTMLDVAHTIEIIGTVLLFALCGWIFTEFQNVTDPELLFKRRQLLTILLIYLTMIISFSASTSATSIAEYISISALVAYFALTLTPLDAITGFEKVPGLPTVVPGQAAFMAGVKP